MEDFVSFVAFLKDLNLMIVYLIKKDIFINDATTQYFWPHCVALASCSVPTLPFMALKQFSRVGS